MTSEQTEMRVLSLRAVAFLILAAVAAGCGDSPTAPANPKLTGGWSGSINIPNTDGPGTYVLTLSLTLIEDDAGAVTGSGVLSAQNVLSFALTVGQGSNAYPNFSLVLTTSGYEDMAFSGNLNSETQLLGRLNGSGFVNQIFILDRQ